jgi:hypothetical protein
MLANQRCDERTIFVGGAKYATSDEAAEQRDVERPEVVGFAQQAEDFSRFPFIDEPRCTACGCCCRMPCDNAPFGNADDAVSFLASGAACSVSACEATIAREFFAVSPEVDSLLANLWIT